MLCWTRSDDRRRSNPGRESRGVSRPCTRKHLPRQPGDNRPRAQDGLPAAMTLAVVILTHNEAVHIRRAILSVKPIASEIFVVDSHSTDATVALAAAEGAVVM